jgi:uncharacterized protein YuzE
MKTTFDKEANAAYIYVVEDEETKVGKTIQCTESINLDLGLQGKLIGVEILDATLLLPKNMILDASRIDKPMVNS